MKLSDEKCRKPTRATIVESIGKNKQADVNKIDVRIEDTIIINLLPPHLFALYVFLSVLNLI